jgi:hypothetical protein
MAIRQQTGGTVQVARLGSKANRLTANERRYRERLHALESL